MTTANKCARLFFLTDHHWGAGYTNPVPPVHFYVGDIAHKALEPYYEQGEDFDRAFARAARDVTARIEGRAPEQFALVEEKYEEAVLKMFGALRGYEAWQAQDDSEWGDANLIHLAVEHDWEVVLDGIAFRGRFDGLVQRRDNEEYWVLEHKTARSLSELEAGLPWDPQRMLYTWAAREGLGLPVEGILYNCIQKSNPYKIPVLQNGLPSKAVRSTVQTTYAVYEAFLEECIETEGLSEGAAERVRGEYEDVLNYLFTDAPVLYKRFPYYATDRELRNHMYWCMEQYHDLARIWHLEDARPSKSRFDCLGCPMKDVCLLIDEGGDWELLLEERFLRKEDYYD
jgi:hypothetical protein